MRLAVAILAGALPLHGSIAPATRVGEDGITGGAGSYLPVFTPDSRHLIFQSLANNLVTNDDRAPWLDLFLYSIDSGETRLVSLNVGGMGGGDGNSWSPSGSADGRYVAFLSDASNLVIQPVPAGTPQVYVRDTVLGRTLLASVTLSGTGCAAPCGPPLLSEDGRFVVFESDAPDLVDQDSNGARDVFVRDLVRGETRLVSVDHAGVASGDGPSRAPQISGDGLTVVFESAAHNLVSPPDGGFAATEVYVRDLRQPAAELVSRPRLGSPARNRSFEPVVSRSGRHVAYKMIDRYGVTDSQGTAMVLLHDRLQPNRYWIRGLETFSREFTSSPIALAGDGSSLVCEVTRREVSPQAQSFVHVRLVPVDPETCTFTPNGTVPAGPGTPGGQPPGPYEFGCLQADALRGGAYLGRSSTDGLRPQVSQDGSVLMIPTGLQLDDPLMSPLWISVPPPGVTESLQLLEGPWIYQFPGGVPRLELLLAAPDSMQLSPDGLWIAFDSPAPRDPASDHNGASDVYLYSLATRATRLISTRDPGIPAHRGWAGGRMALGSLDAEGDRMAFASLWPQEPWSFPDAHSARDLFVSDLAEGATLPVTAYDLPLSGVAPPATHSLQTNQVVAARLGSSGRWVAATVERPVGPFVRKLWIHDLQTRTRTLIRSWPSDPPAPSPYRWEMSADAETVAFEDQGPSTPPDVLLWRRGDPARTVSLGAPLPGAAPAARGSSLRPSVSPNGEWVVFSSTSVDLVDPPFQDAVPRLFKHSVATGKTELLWNRGLDTLSDVQEQAWSGDSTWIAIRTADGICRVLDIRSGVAVLGVAGLTQLQLSQDGHYLAGTIPSNPSTQLPSQVLRMDIRGGRREVASVGSDGVTLGNGDSRNPQLSPDGESLYFSSRATNLVENDDNGQTDIFVRRFPTQATLLLSRSVFTGRPGNGASSLPVLAGNGQALFFRSVASDLIPDDFNGRADLFQIRFDTWDADGDGLPDAWERRHFGGLSTAGPNSDTDGDGVPDSVELADGTDPADGKSFLGFEGIARLPGGTILPSWHVNPWAGYQLEAADQLTDPKWMTLGGPMTSGEPVVAIPDPQPDQAQRYYRLRRVW